MKQIAKEIIDYSRVIFETSEPFKKHTLKNNLFIHPIKFNSNPKSMKWLSNLFINCSKFL